MCSDLGPYEAELHARELAAEDDALGEDFLPDGDDHDEEDPIGSHVAP